MISMSPLLEYSLKQYTAVGSGGSAALSEDDIRQTAALTRAYIVLLLAGVGSYSKVFREDSIAKSKIEATPASTSPVKEKSS